MKHKVNWALIGGIVLAVVAVVLMGISCVGCISGG